MDRLVGELETMDFWHRAQEEVLKHSEAPAIVSTGVGWKLGLPCIMKQIATKTTKLAHHRTGVSLLVEDGTTWDA